MLNISVSSGGKELHSIQTQVGCEKMTLAWCLSEPCSFESGEDDRDDACACAWEHTVSLTYVVDG